MKLSYSKEAKNKISKLSPQIKPLLKSALENLAENPWAEKALQRELLGFYSLRIKKYRVLYRIDSSSKKIYVYTLGLRKTIYEEFSQSLKQQ